MDKTPKAFMRRPNTKLSYVNETFDEEKCRNVLVRYCAHIPRNYQYRDGIRLVFLVLRDHLGDECLGHAGGVLYEMIEVDCQHSDDPGAAFQRWRHDHMNRHADLELPHVPHLTTVTSAITPTATLTRWRVDHPQRYGTRLSDHSPTGEQSFLQTSGIQTKKEWMIEYTMYVSSRIGGTRPFRRINAKDFHELQWNSSMNKTGRIVREKSIDMNDISWNSESDSPAEDTRLCEHGNRLQPSRPRRHSDVYGFLRGVCTLKKPAIDPTRMRWLAGRPGFSTTTSLREILDSRPNPCVNEWEIPNANFARKFGLYTDSGPLPPSIKELPVAEDKAIDVVAGPAMRELMYSWRFQGPFTPQLWFDSGVDHRRIRM